MSSGNGTDPRIRIVRAEGFRWKVLASALGAGIPLLAMAGAGLAWIVGPVNAKADATAADLERTKTVTTANTAAIAAQDKAANRQTLHFELHLVRIEQALHIPPLPHAEPENIAKDGDP